MHAVDNASYIKMPNVDLLTRNTLARLINADPRSKLLSGITPLAYLLSGRNRLPLFSADEVEKLKQQFIQHAEKKND